MKLRLPAAGKVRLTEAFFAILISYGLLCKMRKILTVFTNFVASQDDVSGYSKCSFVSKPSEKIYKILYFYVT
jgi:hypothetical protein